jgi:hypothetical protein
MADEMDVELHRARIDRQSIDRQSIDRQKRKVTYEAALSSLPDGCFVRIDESPYLIWNNALLLWTPEGYTRRHARAKDQIATVLTPEPVAACLRQGYKPEIHDSWRSL